jgi:3-hydroxyisobutyrate dehydrogenase-like beta-hydroxyacid dehydrogenase
MHKDLNLVIDQAKLIGSETPLTKMMLNSLEQSQHDGDNRMDATVIIRNYRKEEKND